MVGRLPSMKNDTSLLSVTTERKSVFTVDLTRCPGSVIAVNTAIDDCTIKSVRQYRNVRIG